MVTYVTVNHRVRRSGCFPDNPGRDNFRLANYGSYSLILLVKFFTRTWRSGFRAMPRVHQATKDLILDIAVDNIIRH